MASATFHRNSLYTVFLMFILLVGAVLAALETDQHMRVMHEAWMKEHGRVYKDAAEKEAHFKVIEAFNNRTDRSSTRGLNQFVDETKEDFMGCLILVEEIEGKKKKSLAPLDCRRGAEPLSRVDWRDSFAVTPVEEQEKKTVDVAGRMLCSWSCGTNLRSWSCGTNLQNKEHVLLSLSVQQVVDCAPEDGCQGGSPHQTFEYIMDNPY